MKNNTLLPKQVSSEDRRAEYRNSLLESGASPQVTVAIEMLLDLTNAQTDFISYLLVELQRNGVLSDAQVHQMIERWNQRFETDTGFPEHGSLGESIDDMYAALKLEL